MVGEPFPAQLASLRAGSLIAGYRLEAQVGVGGMAVVFSARDERLGRLVALKILTPVLATDPAFRRRFIAESRAAAVVDDPHIIPIYEAGEADGVLFIAMRLVRGGDLRRVLGHEEVLSPARAAGFISPVASALDAAHRAGLVHRDVKPANILVDARDGRPDHVYLSDFGVSKGASSSVSVTGAGHFVGTPDYAAPEQIRGGAVDGRTDQYALACVAFQLLTGALPFGQKDGMAVLRTWSAFGSIGSSPDDAESLSWFSNQTIGFTWLGNINGPDQGEWLLDLGLTGNSLLADSRQAMSLGYNSNQQAPSGPVCQEAIVTPDGSAVVCAAVNIADISDPVSEYAFLVYPTATGMPTRTLAHGTIKNEARSFADLLWSNPTGSVLIGAIPTSSGSTDSEVVMVTAGKFTPLPGGKLGEANYASIAWLYGRRG